MLKPSPNHQTLQLTNDDDDDDDDDPLNVPACSVQQLHTFIFFTKHSIVKFNKMQNVFVLIIFNDNYPCMLFMYFCQVNRFLQSFLESLLTFVWD